MKGSLKGSLSPVQKRKYKKEKRRVRPREPLVPWIKGRGRRGKLGFPTKGWVRPRNCRFSEYIINIINIINIIKYNKYNKI